jgi:Recombinase
MSFTPEIRQAAYKVRRARAQERAVDLAPIVKVLRAAGITSLNAIAAALNAHGIQTPAGRHRWYPTQVSRVLKRLAAQRSKLSA